MFRRQTLALLIALLPVVSFAAEFDPAARAATVAPLIDDQTVAVAHVDLARIDVAATFKALLGAVPNLAAEPKRATAERDRIKAWLAAMQKAGAEEMYIILSLRDIPRRPPLVVIPVKATADTERITALFVAGPADGDDPMPRRSDLGSDTIDGKLCLAHTETLAALKDLKPAERPQLAQAFRVAGDTMAQIVFIPSAEGRRQVSERLPELPEELGEVTGKELAEGVQYAALGIDLPPKPNLRLGIQAKDANSAEQLLKVITNALAMAGQIPGVRDTYPRYDELARMLTPRRTEDRLALVLSEQNGGARRLLELITPPLEAAQAAAQRTRSMNNLKMLALAMHNHHDATRAFPPAGSSKEGQPLLSWRVHLLPYLEQEALYRQFKLDEPWDSEHNRELIEKMPDVFASPGMKLDAGQTAYLLPVGDKLAFLGDKKVSIASIRDGTSNTIMIVEARSDQAVTWTKPDDLKVDLEAPLEGMKDARDDGFLAAFFDGSIRFISSKVDEKILQALLTPSGSEGVEAP